MIDQTKLNDAIDYLDRSGKRELADVVRVQSAELATLRDKLEKAEKLNAEVKKFIRVKGRYSTEIAYNRLVAAFDEAIRVAEWTTK